MPEKITDMDFDHDNLRLRTLILGHLDKNLSSQELAELKEILNSSVEAQEYYTEYVMLCAAIRDYVSSPVMSEIDDSEDENSILENMVSFENQAQTIPLRNAAWWTGIKNIRVNKNAIRRVVSVAALAAMFFFVFNGYKAFMAAPVASISDMMHIGNYSSDNQLNVGTSISRSDGRIAFDKGYLKLNFDSARVVMKGPCEFECKGKNKLEIFRGSVYVAMDKGKNGFVVDTPVSRVVDLGTEFGIRLNRDISSDVYVFDGRAKVTLKKSTNKLGYTLSAGSAMKFGAGGLVDDIAFDDNLFAREIDSSFNYVFYGPLTISLVDITAGGTGGRTFLDELWINPDTGYTSESYGTDGGVAIYKPFSGNTFIDGTFVPGRYPYQRQIVSTEGDFFFECPSTCGEYYFNIGINPSVNSVQIPGFRSGVIEFDDVNYNTGNFPSLLMHANLGITYDLRTISKRYPDHNLKRFRSGIGIADLKERAPCNADVWVLVDGEPRYYIKNFSTKGVLYEIDVDLEPYDRYLSLVVTDGGDEDVFKPYGRSYTCDWCVFTDPIIILE